MIRMAQAAISRSKIPTKNPQLHLVGERPPAPVKHRQRRTGSGSTAAVNGSTREGTRGDGRAVVEVAGGITVYPARSAGDRWRAVWYEDGRRRQCEWSPRRGSPRSW